MASVKTENVENFGDDEEEVYLYLDFHSIPLSEEEMKEPNLTLKIVGMESENPVVKINNKFFKGEYEDTIGTHIFFEEDAEHSAQDPLYSRNPKTVYKYMNKTNKVLKMRRIFLESRDDENRMEEGTSTENSSKYQVTKTYQDTLCQLLKPGHAPPHYLSDCLDAKIKSTQEVAEEYRDMDLVERKPVP